MKKNSIFIIGILLIALNSFSQSIGFEDEFADSINLNPIIELPKKYQYGIEIHMLGAGLFIERRIDSKISLGFGGSMLEKEYFIIKPSFYPNSLNSVLALHLYVSYYLSDQLKFEFGTKLGYEAYKPHKYCEGGCMGGYTAAYTNVFYGWKHFKFGSRISVSIITTNSEGGYHPVLTSKPIFLKIIF